jgi:hypothetical protein
LESTHWSGAAFKVALFQPSSACVERVFSMFNNLFGDDRESSLEDLIESSLMQAKMSR